MNFTQVCEQSQLDADAVSYYIEEKLVQPFYTISTRVEDAEYATEDVLLLRAISNMRRLRLPVAKIRALLFEPKKAASIILDQYTHMNRDLHRLQESTKQLDDLDLARFQSKGDVVAFFGALQLNIALPERDLNRDPCAELREKIKGHEAERKRLHTLLSQEERRSRSRGIVAIICFVFLMMSLGFIVAPYIIW